ncbi:MAG TPA: hypothetical protein VEI46_03110 [Thermodesulfovibrionales bacterium]|nr:hypothetical protein [Thermodesulfovibrionales bacterium]
MKRIVILLITCFLLFNTAPAFADFDEAFLAVGDLAFARPGGLAALAIGSAAFIVALPFAAASGSIKQAADTLVIGPFNFTFRRPVGDFQRTGVYVPPEKTEKAKSSRDDTTGK